MNILLEKYLPINTKEKVDLILSDLVKNNTLFLQETDILMNIRKLKIQLYFKEEFSRIKDSIHQIEKLTSNPPSKKKKSKKVPKEKNQENIHFIWSISGLNISEIASKLEKSERLMVSLFKQRILNKSIDKDTVLTFDELCECSEFLSNFKEKKDRMKKQEQNLRKEINSSPSKRKLHMENSQKSYGQEGNYGKLILIRTKS